MIKNKTTLELEIGGKLYTFLCDTDSVLDHVHQALTNFKTFVAGKIQEAQAPSASVSESSPQTTKE